MEEALLYSNDFFLGTFGLTQKYPIRQLADKKIYPEACLPPGRLRTGHSLTPSYFRATARLLLRSNSISHSQA